ncbi:uncharacterized protein ACNLHF_028457 isoform 2-T2 [Anomaloglossus baeobatrachus]
MGFAEDKFWEYLRPRLSSVNHINFDELLIPLSACLSETTVERLHTYVRNQGNMSTTLDFYMDLRRHDNWVNHFINALEDRRYVELAEEFRKVYSSYSPRSLRSSPQSLPSSLNNHNQQRPRENPQCTSSLPGPMPPSSQDTQPGPSPKPMQPEQEMRANSASGHNHEFRSLPPLACDPPPPSRATVTQNVSEPVQSDRGTIEEKTPISPVPETSPYQAAPSERNIWAFQKVPEAVSDSPTSADHGADDGRGRPALDEGDAFPSQAANYQEQSVSPPPARSIRETAVSGAHHDARSAYLGAENQPDRPASPPPARPVREREQQDARSAHQPAANRPERPASSPPARSEEVVSTVKHNARSAPQPAANRPERPAAPPPASSVRDEVVSTVKHNARSAPQPTANRPERPAAPPPASSVREGVVSTVKHNTRSAPQPAAKRPERPLSPAPARSVREEVASRERHDAPSARQPVRPSSSCRPLLNNDDDEEVYFSKPGVLDSTRGFGDDTDEDGALSATSGYKLQISDCTEGNESCNSSHRSSTTSATPRNVRHRSSPTSATPRNVPAGSAPNNRPMPVATKSPEENDFTFDRSNTSKPYRFSPGGNEQLDQSSSKQPEENSFGSRGVSHYRLEFNEGPDAELMDSNDDGLRNRRRKSPNPNKTDDWITEETCSRGMDYERSALITVTVLSLCLSVYLLWKSRHN